VAHGASPSSNTPPLPNLQPTAQESQAALLAVDILTHYHYKTVPLDDAMSERIFDNYLKLLDPERLYFMQTDVDDLTAGRATLARPIIGEDLAFPFAVFNVYAHRMSERFMFARTLLRRGFDFRKEETYRYERETKPWPKSKAEMNEIWRKVVKNDWLRLKLAGEDDRKIVETLDARYSNALKRIGQETSKDVFQVFMNAYTTAIEPHTTYMRPRAAAEFDAEMKLSLVGIGVTLEQKSGYCTIREVDSGGPAALSGKLKIGDRILGVAHGAGGVMTDVQGLRMDEAVAMLRGAAGTLVTLDILPADAGPDGKRTLVSLILKTINLEAQAARKAILPMKKSGTAKRLIGVITLPSFYEDFEAREKSDPQFRSATRDVMRLLKELEDDKVDGVLIDLRGNGGGSLDEAVGLTSLFVGNGPVVQERDAHGDLATLQMNSGPEVVWVGPLGVLIDRGSASASEIFAAAIQDYGRGLVIGSRSFGKGTVQTGINLDQTAKNEKRKFGELNMTIAQFFRIDGNATQLRGVEPDIALPSMIDAERFGESSFDNALPWSRVPAAEYAPVGVLKPFFPALRELHEARVKGDKKFLNLEKDIAESSRIRDKGAVSLNEVQRRRERDALEQAMSLRSSDGDAGEVSGPTEAGRTRAAAKNWAMRDDGLQTEERALAPELAAEKADKQTEDILLNEAANILSDEVGLLKAKARFVSRILKDSSPAPEH
jgi:carboxyl-terminal processing protease